MALRPPRPTLRRRQLSERPVVTACRHAAGSILCIVLAISIGFRAVNIAALGMYLIGVVVMLRPARAAA